MALDKAQKAEIKNRMGYHPANKESAVHHDAARTKAINATIALASLPMDARHRAVVITKMEEALMWANKGIALGETGSPVAKDGATVHPAP
jgi:hypothetical protein